MIIERIYIDNILVISLTKILSINNFKYLKVYIVYLKPKNISEKWFKKSKNRLKKKIEFE